MRHSPRSRSAAGRVHPYVAIGVLLALLLAAAAWFTMRSRGDTAPAAPRAEAATGKVALDTVRLTAEQAREVAAGPVQTLAFEQRREAVGLIDFDQDHSVQVFSPYQGRIGQVQVKAGDTVAAGQVLYTVLVPDLAQAASALVAAAGNLKASSDTLARARQLYEAQSIAQKELQQNQADQQAADAAYRAARKTLALFGLREADIDRIEHQRQVDTEMPVRSPQAGRVTARAAAPGQLVQPGTAPAPVSVSDTRRLWMVASVPESELGAYRLGQKVSVAVAAYPKQVFDGTLNLVGEAADPASHRITLRAEVADPQHLLRAQMLASFRIVLGPPQTSPAVPVNAVAREGDGSYSVWTTEDGLQFKRATVATGQTQDGMVQILSGLAPGRQVARDKALFLSNLYSLATD